MKTAAAYIRVSDERQDEYSPDSQIRLIHDFAKKNGFTVPQEYIFFDDGISAKTAKKRTQFNQMIALAKEKEAPFEAILVWKFSRFARNQEESIVYKNILRKKGIQVISISEPIIDSPFGELIERIIEWMDEYYLINLSTEVKRGMMEKLSRGEAMCPPAFGYDIVDKKYIPNDEAVHVREIFNDFIDGVTMRQIAMKCAAKGLKTHRGNPLEARTIRYILNNPVYIGKIRWSTDGRASSLRDYSNPNTVIVDGIHEPIISAEVWDKTQSKMKELQKMYGRYQRAEQPVEWMLKGLMRCDCGATLTFLSTKTPSIQCYEYTKGKGKCSTSHCLSLAKANRLVIAALESCVDNMNFNIVPHEKPKSGIDYNKLIQREQIKLERAKEAYLSGIDTKEEYKANKDRITKAIRDIEKERNAETAETVDLTEYSDKVRQVLKTVKDPTASELMKNKALRTILSHITYQKPQNNLALFFYA